MGSVQSKYLTFKEGNKSTIRTPFKVVVVVSKKIAKLATDRNKLKRQVRELFKNVSKKGIVYTKKGITNLSFKELSADADELINKID